MVVWEKSSNSDKIVAVYWANPRDNHFACMGIGKMKELMNELGIKKEQDTRLPPEYFQPTDKKQICLKCITFP